MPKQIQLIAYEIDTHDTAKIHSILSAQGAHPRQTSEAEYVTLQANERGEVATGRSTAAATRARWRKTPFVAVTLALAVLARDASANPPWERARVRQLIDAAVFVVTGGGRAEPTYKWSDKGDHARTIAKNSMLTDSTYQNRVILTDIFYKDSQNFIDDLDAVGHTAQAGYVMLRGYNYNLNSRIPLTIPSTTAHTCNDVCKMVNDHCLKEVKQKMLSDTDTEKDAVRRCIYTYFRMDLFNTLTLIAEDFGENKRGTWDVELDKDPSEYNKWVEQWKKWVQQWKDTKHLLPKQAKTPQASLQRAMVIALGTPVSFYSHNPLKPVGYHYDTKKDKTLECSDTIDPDLKLKPGAAECSDFDIKIYWPDMVYDYMQKVLTHKGPGLDAFHKHLREGDLAKSPSPQAVQFLREHLPINFKIVDGGKQHVLKNVTGDYRGVYQKYPPLADFVKRWTAAFGREVDVKLELSVSTPVYLAIPGGPIAIYDAEHSPSAAINVDDKVNNESRASENLDPSDQ